MSSEYICKVCNEVITHEDIYEMVYSRILGGEVCSGCVQEMFPSTVVYLEKDKDVRHIYIDEINIKEKNEVIEPSDFDLSIWREYKQTDDWRGYYETTVKGFTSVMEGWTTGGWDDPVGERKALFNDWVETLTDGARPPYETYRIPCTIIIVIEPTSNIFSQAISVMVRDEDTNLFTQLMGEELQALKEALK